MKTWQFGEKKIELHIGEELTVLEMRKIFPLRKKFQEGELNEIELSVELIKAFSNQENIEEIVNSLSMDDFEKLSVELAEIITPKKKSQK